MRYCSTRDRQLDFGFGPAVIRGLAPDGGLFVPRDDLRPVDLKVGTLASVAADFLWQFVREDFEQEAFTELVSDALNFPVPLVEVEKNIYSLELFHGPTLAFKDVGARFMGRVLPALSRQDNDVVVLVATSGDTGGAVANGLYEVPGVQVVVLYPRGKVSPLQEKQFASLGSNVHAICVDGVFDDCQRLVKGAFADKEITSALDLTTANSINIARWLPQSVYYFWMYSQLGREAVVSVPSGNFGNFTAGLLAYKAGLPASRWIAACNVNDTVPRYLESGAYDPRPSIQTVANAMDVGDPSNFERLTYLFGGDLNAINEICSGAAYTDDDIRTTIVRCYESTGYLLDPHGACGYQALKDTLREGETGVFLETAHPSKFAEVYETIGIERPIHATLEALRDKPLLSTEMENDQDSLKQFLLSRFHG